MEDIEKINFNDITCEYEVKNKEAFAQYLKQVWKDLIGRSGDTNEASKGLDKVTFQKYYELPGLISERLFSVFDNDNKGYLSLNDFTSTMLTLFSSDFNDLLELIFKFYDFDRDDKITKEDIRMVLSYVPTYKKNKKNNENSGLKFDTEDFQDRLKSQKELHDKLNIIFGQKENINLEEFTEITKNKNSDIFLFILVFLYEHRPFSSETVKNLENIKKSPLLSFRKKEVLIASPNLDSNLCVTETLQKSPAMKNANLGDRMTKNNNVYKKMKFLGLLSGRYLNNNINIKENNDNNIKENEHNNNTVISLQIPVIPPAQKESKEESKINDNTEETKEEEKDITSKGQRKPARKSLKFFSDKNKVTEEKKNYNENEEEEEMNFSYARPFEGRDILNKKKKSKDEEEKMNTKEIDEDNEDNEINEQNEDDIPDSNEKQEDTTEGYLYKIQGNKMKKIYFKLIHKDLYYYKSKDIKKHKGMHNLSGVYIKDEGVVTIKDKKLYCFNIIFPSKERKYYLQNEKEYLKWVESIRKVVHYSNLRDLYKIKGNLGKGKFGLVKLGEHKESGRQVAIKIINKEVIEGMELERIKSEIDILKIAKHPNIIKLYDVFENEKYIYIIMEYCAGGDLFNYIEKRDFKIKESRAAEIVHKLCTAVYFLHQYGIIHRDLKPENILMTDITDDADIRLVDFGLGKMIGPGEKCDEPFGTFSYVAPEVLQEKPYDFKVDLFAIGIITYLLVAGFLPFDDENSEKEIARQTVYEPTPFPSFVWKNISLEAKMFVDNLLDKNPDKRMNIQEVLQHKWLQKFSENEENKKDVFARRKSADLSGGDKFVAFSTMNINDKDDKDENKK
jgi:hypothetical protein